MTVQSRPADSAAIAFRPQAKRGYHHGDLPNSVAAVALELMTERNGPDFSLREIASRLGVHHPSVYRHFRDKAALLQRITADGFKRLHDYQMAKLEGIEDPFEKLLCNGRNHVRFCLDNPGLFKLMFDYGIAEVATSSEIEEARGQAAALLMKLIEDCQRAGVLSDEPAELIRVGLWSMAHGLVHLLVTRNFAQLMSPEPPLDQKIDRILIAAIRGFSR